MAVENILEKAMTSAEANQIVKNMHRLKIQGLDSAPTGMKLDDFVKKLITQYFVKHATVYVSNGNLQTPAGARRSLQDITKICMYYYPDEKITLELIKNILKPLVAKKEISTGICKMIHRRVFFDRKPSGKANDILRTEDRDEFGWKFNYEKPTKIPGERIVRRMLRKLPVKPSARR